MQISPTKVVRSYMNLYKKGRGEMYSDKTTFGRSIKVWGFNDSDYSECVTHLRKHGYLVRIALTPYGQTRLHVFTN